MIVSGGRDFNKVGLITKMNYSYQLKFMILKVVSGSKESTSPVIAMQLFFTVIKLCRKHFIFPWGLGPRQA